MDLKKGSIVELEQKSIIIRIPNDSVFLKLDATIIDGDGNIHTVTRKYTLEDITHARDYFEEYVGDEDYDGYYVLTEKGENYLKEMNVE